MALWGDGISALLIDGKLSDGRAGTFPTVNPATEEVLGVAADADAEDMGRAIEAARRAFDSTDWSRNTELRVRCVRQLRDAMQQHVEELRELTISEVGAPRMLTASAQLEGPVGDLSFAADTAASYPWKQDLGEASPLGIATRRTLAREAVGVGPLISARQRDRVQGYLDLAVAEGGRFACGGARPADREVGFYIEPTVIAGLTNDARVAREEIFGPVLTVIAHDGDDDAVRIANDSPYGLSGTVYGADPQRAARIASRLRVGTVNVNGGVWYCADAPFGGYKQSGIGREMGLLGFEEYLEAKLIATAAN